MHHKNTQELLDGIEAKIKELEKPIIHMKEAANALCKAYDMPLMYDLLYSDKITESDIQKVLWPYVVSMLQHGWKAKRPVWDSEYLKGSKESIWDFKIGLFDFDDYLISDDYHPRREDREAKDWVIF